SFAALGRWRWRRRRRRGTGRSRKDHGAVRASLSRRRRRWWWRRWRRGFHGRRRGGGRIEVVDQAREQAVRGIVARRLCSERNAVQREGVVEVELGGAEVTVLQPRIEVGSHRVAQAGDALESPGVVLVAGHRGPGAAGAAADITAEPAAEIP